MQIKDLIIGLMACILFFAVSMNFVTDFYSSENLNLDLSLYPETAYLASLQENFSQARSEIDGVNNDLQSNVPGGTDVEYSTGSITEGDLIKASFTAITSIPTYLSIFSDLVIGMLVTLGLGEDFIWFFITALFSTIVLLLLSSVLRNGI